MGGCQLVVNHLAKRGAKEVGTPIDDGKDLADQIKDTEGQYEAIQAWYSSMASQEQKNTLQGWGLEGNHFSNKDDFDGWVTENEGDGEAMNAVLAWVRGEMGQ